LDVFKPAPAQGPFINTLDAVPPTSATQSPNGIQQCSSFLVSWSGADDANGSGLRSFDVYVDNLEDADPAYLWQANTITQSALFTGVPGQSYGFYTRARDNVGNLESTPQPFGYDVEVTDGPICVYSIVRANPNPTNASSVNFTVTFSAVVTGVDVSDFKLTTTTGVTDATVTGVTPVSGTTYTVTVNTGSGNGTIRLDVVDDDTIKDGSNNPLGGAGMGNGNYTGGETYMIFKGFNPIAKWTSSFDLSHGWTVADYVRTVGDVNGDGRDDLVGFGQDGVYVALSNGTDAFGTISKWTSSFDLSHSWTVKDFVRTVGDVNGDGRDDLVGFGQDGVYVALSNGTDAFGGISKWTSSFDLSHGWTVKDFVRTVGDVNGDGRDDLVGFGQDGVYVALSNGTDAFGAISKWTNSFDLSHGWTVSQFTRTVGDVNGDGNAEPIGFGLDGVYSSLSMGNIFSLPNKGTSSFDLSHGWTVSQYVRTAGDVNGDGKDDLIGFGLDGVYVVLGQ